jgi:hypothetical protein
MESGSRLEGRRYKGRGKEKQRYGKGYTKGKGTRYKETHVVEIQR